MNPESYITCRQLIDFIADYLGGSLPVSERCEFERHLAVCPSCVAYLDSYNRTVAMGQRVLKYEDSPASGQVPETLLRAIQRARQHKG